MKRGSRSIPLGLLLALTAAACASRSPVSQAKDRAPRVSRASAPARASGAGVSAGISDHELTGDHRVAPLREAASTPHGPIVGHAVGYARTLPVRDLPSSIAEANPNVSQPGREINEENSDDPKVPVAPSSPKASLAPKSDEALAAPQAINAVPGPNLTFEGNSSANNTAVFGGTVAPPDTNGAVGPNHFVETTNLLVGVYDKTGTLIGGRFKMSSVFAPLGGVCAALDDGDPVVNYDKLADRWVLSQFAFSDFNNPPYHQCIAVSVNGDPTGSYYAYDFITPGGNFPDYPKLVSWPDAYYMTDHQFDHGGPFNGSGAFAFDRSKMLVGDPTATFVYFNLDFTFEPNGIFGILASDFDGLQPPPAGAPNVFVYPTADEFGDTAGDALRLFDFHADFANPVNSTFTERSDSPLTVAAYDPRNPSGRADIPQPAPATAADNLDSISSRLMYRLQYQNRNGTETLVANQTVNVGVHPAPGVNPTAAEYQAGIRYYELTRTSPSGAFSITEQATHAPDTDDRWLGSIAEDNSGDLLLGFSQSSTTTFPSLRYGGRLAGDTPGGLVQGEATLFAGTASQQDTGSRWGDYSSTQLDPTDFCTFWIANEYYSVFSNFNWRTRIGSVRYPSCVSPAMGKITGTVKDCATNLPIVGAIVTASDGHSAATGPNGTYSITVPPGTYTVTASDPFRNCNPSAPQTATVSNGGSTTKNFCLTGNSKLNAGAVAVDDSLGNNNGTINVNECVKLTIGLKNEGCIADTNISGTLSTSTPGVTIKQALSTYPNLAVNASGTNTTPFALQTSPTFSCGPIDLTLMVSSDHQPSHALHFSVPTCAGGASVTVTGSLGPGDTTQDGRLGRNAIASTCGTPKACPGVFASSLGSPRFFDSFTFPNTAAASACLKIDLTPNCTETPASANQIFSVAYLDSYIPSPGTQECVNYLGDIGGSPANGSTGSYSVDVAGGHNLVMIVNTVNNSASACSSYTAKVSGFFDLTPANGACPACTVSSSVATSTLWPANHNLINVGLSASTNGVCPAINSVTVFSDEDDLQAGTVGDQSPDAKNIGLGTLRLRAERQDSGDGRVYLIVTRASDGTGNGNFSCNTVTVSKTQNTGDKNSVAAQAAAAQTFCTNNGGTPPAGYFVVGDGPVIGPKQ